MHEISFYKNFLFCYDLIYSIISFDLFQIQNLYFVYLWFLKLEAYLNIMYLKYSLMTCVNIMRTILTKKRITHNSFIIDVLLNESVERVFMKIDWEWNFWWRNYLFTLGAKLLESYFASEIFGLIFLCILRLIKLRLKDTCWYL